jgi:uncharacterized protein (TIGR03437 family)
MSILNRSLTRIIALFSILLGILCPARAGQIYQTNILSENVGMLGLPAGKMTPIGVYSNDINLVGITTTKSSIYAVSHSKRTSTLLLSDNDTALKGSISFAYAFRVREGILYFATTDPQTGLFVGNWQLNIDTGALTPGLDSIKPITVKRLGGGNVTGRVWYASPAFPSYDGKQLLALVEMLDPSVTTPSLSFTYVGLIRVDDPSATHQEIIAMQNFNVGGRPSGILQPWYGFSPDSQGGIDIVEGDNNSMVKQHIVHYNADGTYSVPFSGVGSVGTNGKTITFWTFVNNIPIDPFTGDFILTEVTDDNTANTIRFDGATIVPFMNTFGGVVSNNTPCFYARTTDSIAAATYDELVCTNGDTRKFNINDQLADGTIPPSINGETTPNGAGSLVWQMDQKGIATSLWINTIPYVTTPPTSASAGAQVVVTGVNLTSYDGSLATTLVDASTGQVVSLCSGTSTQVTCANAPQYSGNYSLTVNVGTVPSAPFTLSVTGQGAPPPPMTPVVVGMFNAAGDTIPITAGSFFTAVINNAAGASESTGPIPPQGLTNLGGLTMTICGSPAYLIYRGDSGTIQVNGIVPLAASGQPSCPVVVTNNGVISATYNAVVGDNPSEFLYNFNDGNGKSNQVPIITTLDGTWFMSSDMVTTMASGPLSASIKTTSTVQAMTTDPQTGVSTPGVLVFYLTGLDSATSPTVPDGQLASTQVLTQFVNTPTVKFNGNLGKVLFAGIVPGASAGLQQVNVQIPYTLDGSETITIETTAGTIATLSLKRN